ncbi:MFS transporter [Curtobacterium sp. ISL-83]|uniref:MFS transporter n=1 Tax=Curtobacterium sp. ISL-83 TaxID=2819145 RepID=UPI001BE6D838|nr:MFS transporter [Curtobacterium sp. ISL-83]MBT2504127.1 MFS transporter [Curtobacterium sp. ISL-83]
MTGRQRVALAVLLTASFTLAVDFSILNVALPTIGADVGFAIGNLQWVATAFALCAAGFTLLMGRVADIAGRRRMFLIGMVLLGAGSLAGGLATTPALLLIARVAQGLATAIAVPSALALLITAFPEGRARDRALGLNGSLMAAGFTTGAILGGLLTDLLSWRWAFLINVPVAIGVLIVAPMVLQDSRTTHRTRLDVPGAITVTLGLLALVYGLTTAAEASWTSPTVLESFAASVVLLTAFALIERRAPHPLAPGRTSPQAPGCSGREATPVGIGRILVVAALTGFPSGVIVVIAPREATAHGAVQAAGLLLAALALGEVLGAIGFGWIRSRGPARSQLMVALALGGGAFLVAGATSASVGVLAGALVVIGLSAGPVAVLLSALTDAASKPTTVGRTSGFRISVTLVTAAVGSAFTGASNLPSPLLLSLTSVPLFVALVATGVKTSIQPATSTSSGA